MGDLDYLFAVLRAEGDRFSGYSALSTESAGYGRRFIAGDRAILETEAGAGARQTHFVDGSRRNEGIVRLGAKAVCRFSAGSELREEAFSEISKDNIHTESVTSLKSRVNGNLSMKLSVSAVHNSRVPPGIKKTDTVTAMTLVFDY
jgi:putative salt-induced outer membrane protein